MKTTVVPAQITTVEDRIAGNLNFPQIILLVFSLIIGAAIYAVFPPNIHLSAAKIVLIVLQFAVFGGLAIRYNGKILAEWLTIYMRYHFRPRIYIFSKNDCVEREVIMPEIEKTAAKPVIAAKVARKNKEVADQIDGRSLIDESAFAMSIRPSKKGGMDVVLREL